MQVYNELRIHNDIRFSISKVDSVRDKVFLLLQVRTRSGADAVTNTVDRPFSETFH